MTEGNGICIYRRYSYRNQPLPFKKFGPNAAFYYCMVIGFFLFETFKEDALSEVIYEKKCSLFA